MVSLCDHMPSEDSTVAAATPEPALGEAPATTPAAVQEAAAPAADSSTPAEGQPYDDVIRWPDEPPPPPEMWEIPPVHDWEKEERSYIFEDRLGRAAAHKAAGNDHFKAEEWELALRRYKRAIYESHFDEMQMYDLMDHHKETAFDIQVPCKLNLTACIVRMTEDGSDVLPEGSLDHAVQAIGEVLKARPKEAKAYFRKGQVLMLQSDLPGAREALNEAAKLLGKGAAMRDAFAKLRQLEKAEKERQRAMFGGKIQTTSTHKVQEAAETARLARRTLIYRAFRAVTLPFTLPFEALFSVALALVRWARGSAHPKDD
uniref:peptidylprolyl isomerase n=1 Tax=Haptolina brevifila TaxID=156173 RepID=A0A7S2HBY1_9EUKA|mmetsp:Transcript_52953/g.105230  ORF Transcript_52953/g.105230 Transcript_52953/m.105230 type:complete len:316 (+) Transcript_52953:2-949(+)